MSRLVICFVFLLIIGSVSSVQIIEDKEYWELPSYYPVKSPYGGIFEVWQSAVRWRDNTDLQYVDYSWDKVNPSEGVINWDLLNNRPTGSYNYGFDELRANGKSAIFYTALSEYSNGKFFTPQWVLDKCAFEGTPVSIIYSSEGRNISAIWEECSKRELIRYIKSLSVYKNDPVLSYAYMPTFRWGEFYMLSSSIDDAISKGLTGDVLKEFCKNYTDAWVYALGADKLIWEGHGSWGPTTAGFRDATSWCDDYAVNQIGTNLREGMGGINRFVSQPFTGHYFDSDHYLYAPTIQEIGGGVSFYGTEFTEGSLGIFDDYPYFRMAILNMMRGGINWPTFGAQNPELLDHENDATYPEFAALRDYYRQVAGYPVDESPDAWAILLQWSDYSCYSTPVRPNNYEKFLIQREVSPNGKTVLVERNDWPIDKAGFCPTRESYAYLARSTNHSGGSDYIYFNLRDSFLKSSENNITFSVYYKDNNNANWRIEYNSLTGDYAQTESVQNLNDGKWKSALFTLEDAQFRNAQTGGMDFRLYNGGSQDIAVGSVRVIRLQSSDQICNHLADYDFNCKIEREELNTYVAEWKSNSGISLNQIIDAIGKWKAGGY